ncbi:phage tail protein, partial [Jeotgalibacillus marinus]
SAISLEKIAGLEHEKVRLGDTVFIIDREFVPEILVEGRVIELKRVRNEPERTEIKLGNFLPLYTDDTRLDDVVDTI